MGLITEHAGAFDEYEAVALPQASLAVRQETAVFLRRSARPSRRAVLHLRDLRSSFAPADLARWYNERGFHFYVTDLDVSEAAVEAPRHPARSAQPGFASLDAALRYLRGAGGIDAVILSAEGPAAPVAARWCDARRVMRPVDALIMSYPDFGRAIRGRLRIGCPVLVISAVSGREADAGRRHRGLHGHGDISLGQHVTWLNVGDPAATDSRRRLFDEMGRWLGAYMYGKVRDQLL